MGPVNYGSTDEPPPDEYWMPLKLQAEPSLAAERRTQSSQTDLTSVADESLSLLLDEICPDSPTQTNRFFALLGFSSNPFATNEEEEVCNNKAADMRLSMLSNFSTAYNVVCISMALDIMQELYEITPKDKSLSSSALIAGMIIGQLIGGAIGDIIGRHMAMTVVMSLQILGALFTAFAVGSHVSIYVSVAFWRLVLGIGCGGVYPLAATIMAESSDGHDDNGKAVALTFSMQGIGYLFPPMLTAMLSPIIPLSILWRLILGFGAIPGICLMGIRLNNRMVQTKGINHDLHTLKPANSREVPVSIWHAISLERELFGKMMGTGGCWFLFDVLFYGNVLFQPIVLSAAFGQAETVQKAAFDSFVVSLLALPGYFASVMAMGRQSPRRIQSQGFFMMAVLYGCIGCFFQELKTSKLVLVFLYGGTFFFSNYGPNATTYVLPSMTFSRPCRSTLNGICAACGKAGALIGSMMFVFAASQFGEGVVMLACAGVSLLGLLVTLCCVPETVNDAKTDGSDERNVPMRIVVSKPSLLDDFDAA